MKIVLFRRNGVIAPHVTDDYAIAFEQLGHEILYVRLEEGFGLSEIQNIKDFKPDIAVAYGSVGIFQDGKQFLLRQMGIPLVSLHYDNPFFSIDEGLEVEFQEHASYYYHFVWDKYCLQLLTERNIKNVHPIMLATNPLKFYPNPQIKAKEGEIAFVGNIAKVDQNVLEENLEQMFVNFIINEKVKNINIPTYDLCREAFLLKEFEPIRYLYEKHPYAFWRNIYMPIHTRGSAVLRQHVLNSISGIDIHMYGSKEIASDHLILHPSVPYSELSSLYQSYAVNLNISSIQLETSVNNRIFDVFASKSFVLSDYKDDMKLIFPNVWNEISFGSLEELVIKGDYFLTHPKERIELVEELYEHVITKHTYKERAMEVIEIVTASKLNYAREKELKSYKADKNKEIMKNCPVCSGSNFSQLYSIQGHDGFETNLHRCAECCTVFMNPQPTEGYLDWFYNNVYYSNEHRTKMGWSTDLEQITPGLLAVLEARMDLVETYVDQTKYPRGKLLDLGCSTGNFVLEAQLRYWDVKGVEISEKAAQIGRLKHGLNVITGSLDEHLFDKESFDVVTAFDVLEHIPNPHHFMENINRILKTGGLFIANTPNVSSTASYHSGSNWRHLDPPLHVILYDHISLRILMRMHNFKILKISGGSEYLGQMQIVAMKED
ncbi:methyltransferase domain-containing protein [Paenibacillus polymyxa]|uniref:methyltransferase domain-containing protein n=1 Tax=Paenibacillus polymyxa TaxID=1406 RepID=UPI003D2A00DD